MKKIDLAAFLLIGLVAWILLREPSAPSSKSGEGQTQSSTSGSESGQENAQKKIQDNSQSVLTNLDDQLDKFADELAADVEGVNNLDPEVAGFEGGIPEAYAPKSTASFGSKQKLADDLEFRLKKFGNDAYESEQEFVKTHEASGKDQKEYRALVSKHLAQKKQIMGRHREIVQQYGAETPAEPKLR